MTARALPRLAIVTKSGLSPSACADGVQAALSCMPAGRALVVLRDTSRTCGEEHVRALAQCCAASRAPLFVHMRLGAAFENRHFPDSPNALDAMRDLRASHPHRLISASTHSAQSAIAAAEIADVVFLGPIWPSRGKPDGLGTTVLSAAAAEIRGPGHLFALGGVTNTKRGALAMACGAYGLAGIRQFNGPTIAELSAVISSVDTEQT